MFRRSCALFLLPIACAALAAPAPKSGWNKPIDPDHDCKFISKDGTITLEVPGGDHDLAPKRKRFNAPRLLREIEGDFIVQVRVSASFRPSAKSGVEGHEPRVAAGLLLILTEKDYIRLDYTAYRLMKDRELKGKAPPEEKRERKGDVHRRPTFQMQGSQVLEMELGLPWKSDPNAKEEQFYLRFERKGNGFREAISLDGKTWTTHISTTGLRNLPRKFKVGLAAYSTSTEPFKVRFDQFKLIQGGEKSK